jgi:prefoldin subunit 5
MECLFPDFDYALADAGGNSRVVARNKETAFLTKHLKAYGGRGVYGGERVGRVFRNLVFSGKGLVETPANPESEILRGAASFDFGRARKALGYSPPISPAQPEPNRALAMEVDLQKKVDELTAQNEKLTKALAEKAEAATKQAAEKVDALAEDNKALAAKAAGLEASVSELTAKNAELATANAGLAETIAKAEAAKVTAERVSAVAEKLGFDKAGAEALVDSFEGVTDAKFAAAVEKLAKAMAAQAPPKGTPAADPPKGTPAPLPPKATAAREEDDEDVPNADPANLGGAKADAAPALSVPAENSGVSQVQKAIAAYFDYEIGDAE